MQKPPIFKHLNVYFIFKCHLRKYSPCHPGTCHPGTCHPGTCHPETCHPGTIFSPLYSGINLLCYGIITNKVGFGITLNKQLCKVPKCYIILDIVFCVTLGHSDTCLIL